MKQLLLVLAFILIGIGLLGPSRLTNITVTNPSVEKLVIDAPTKPELKLKANDVIKALSSHNDRRIDGPRLANLYNDIGTLISLDGEDQVIKTTDDIRQANSLAGLMLKLNIKGKYPNLPLALNSMIKSSVGEDNVILNEKLRNEASSAFKALAWACIEGGK